MLKDKAMNAMALQDEDLDKVTGGLGSLEGTGYTGGDGGGGRGVQRNNNRVYRMQQKGVQKLNERAEEKGVVKGNNKELVKVESRLRVR